MAKMSEVFDLLDEGGENIQVLLVTTDPANDSPENLGTYLANFHTSFLGLNGSEYELKKAYQDYGVVVMDDGETHSNRFYVVDRKGNLRLSWPYEMTASDIASDLINLLREH